MRHSDWWFGKSQCRFAGAVLVAGVLASACGSGAIGNTDGAATQTDELATTTTADAARSIVSPDGSNSSGDAKGSGDPTTIDEAGPSTTDQESSAGSTSVQPSGASPDVGVTTTRAPGTSTTSAAPTNTPSTPGPSSTSTTTLPSGPTTTGLPSSTTTTTTTSAVSTPRPDRIDLPTEVASTEGVAVDPTSGRVFVGELNNGNIWVGSLDPGSFSLFASGAAAGRSTALGLATDAQRRRLYVVSPANNRVDVLDLDTGGLLRSIAVPVGAGSLINDATVAPDGTIYISDTGRPTLYRIISGSNTAELWVDYSSANAVPTAGRSQHGNGIVANDNHVLVAYMTGGELLRFDRTTGAAAQVPISGAPTAGRDGLVLCGNRLYGVDIASLAGGQESVWITQLSSDWASGSSAGVIRADSFSSASTAAALGGSLVVVNAQFGVVPPQNPFWLTVEPASC